MDNTAQEYINKMREAGKSDSEIKQAMEWSGWDEKDIILGEQPHQQPTPQQEKTKKKLYKKWLFWVILFIFLFISLALLIILPFFFFYGPGTW